MHLGVIKVLLVEDDEDDYIIARDLFAEIRGDRFTLDWTRTFQAGLDTMLLNQHDVCLVDYRLGAQNGVDLLCAALEQGCQTPIILLTGTGEHQIDVEAMQAGATDYLVKSQLRSDSLERSIRYALQRKRATAEPQRVRERRSGAKPCGLWRRGGAGPGAPRFAGCPAEPLRRGHGAIPECGPRANLDFRPGQ